mmetsp:Transcript_17148/g.23125  ORF Transcript_17148/g.23125 Transcript_17148/m.23125 type:complete len:135 (+) Transcript_17148:215-619(+)
MFSLPSAPRAAAATSKRHKEVHAEQVGAKASNKMSVHHAHVLNSTATAAAALSMLDDTLKQHQSLHKKKPSAQASNTSSLGKVQPFALPIYSHLGATSNRFGNKHSKQMLLQRASKVSGSGSKDSSSNIFTHNS